MICPVLELDHQLSAHVVVWVPLSAGVPPGNPVPSMASDGVMFVLLPRSALCTVIPVISWLAPVGSKFT